MEVRSLIAAYRENYDRLKSTKSSHGKKSVWNGIMGEFLSLCRDHGVDSQKTLVCFSEWDKTSRFTNLHQDVLICQIRTNTHQDPQI